MATKTQVFPTKEIARTTMLAAYAEAKAIADIRNADDPDLNEVVEYTTHENLKCYILTRPDMQEGVVEIYYYWE